jgi:hypothetical protein
MYNYEINHRLLEVKRASGVILLRKPASSYDGFSGNLSVRVKICFG